jgi:hypothetical protein
MLPFRISLPLSIAANFHSALAARAGQFVENAGCDSQVLKELQFNRDLLPYRPLIDCKTFSGVTPLMIMACGIC